MTRRVGFTDGGEARDPGARKVRAIVTFAALETPLVLAVTGFMLWLYTDLFQGFLPPAPPEEARTLWLVGALVVFGLCVALLYAKVLWPVLREARDARR